MPDIVDPATRSRMMSGIRATNTKPEKLIRSLLHRAGFRFRLHVKDLPGKPDIVLPRYRAAILVHGCFWHAHDCALFKWPTSRGEWWREKLERNRTIDDRTKAALRSAGWRVATVWECALKGPERLELALVEQQLIDWLRERDSPELELRGIRREQRHAG